MPDALAALLSPSAPAMPEGRHGRVYGGAVLARSLVAAAASSHAGSRVHSLHAHFLHPATPTAAATFETTVLRASRRFTTVQVRVRQSGLVAAVTVSFHTAGQTSGHAPQPPQAPGPEGAAPAGGGPIPDPDAPIRAAFDFRAGATRHDESGRPAVGYWLRCRDPLPRRPGLHAAALTWASDFALTRVADLEHEHEPGQRQAASLDHAMWFHDDVDLDDWLHYEITSPVYREGLALSTGSFRRANGSPVATVVQESLLRRVQPPVPSSSTRMDT